MNTSRPATRRVASAAPRDRACDANILSNSPGTARDPATAPSTAQTSTAQTSAVRTCITPATSLAEPPPAGRGDNAKLDLTYVAIESLTAYAGNPRKHPKKQIDKLVASIAAFGLVQPLIVNAAGVIVGGHAVWEAAKRAGLTRVPVVRLEHLDDVAIRKLRLGLNKLAEESGWDEAKLALEFEGLLELELTLDLDLPLTVTGFDMPEIDQCITLAERERADGEDAEGEAADLSALLEPAGPPVSRLGDVWILDEHRLLCGDALEAASYAALMGGEMAAMGIHDAPYDVPIRGHVSGSGRHREFVMGSGELGAGFAPFLTGALAQACAATRPGGLQYMWMDWRHMGEMLAAGAASGLELVNLCVWNKGAGGMGSFYRSAHELVFVFASAGPRINNVMLGVYGRNRTNVWDHPGAVALRRELEHHPTPKPVTLLAEAIRDASHRGDLVLDVFCGSGSTLIAAAKVGRRARGIELDPLYVDVAVRRWEAWSGGTARHAATGLSFAAMATQRAAQAAYEPEPAAPVGPDEPITEGEAEAEAKAEAGAEAEPVAPVEPKAGAEPTTVASAGHMGLAPVRQRARGAV